MMHESKGQRISKAHLHMLLMFLFLYFFSAKPRPKSKKSILSSDAGITRHLS